MKILLPTDGSGYSEAAAKFLQRLRLSSDDEITILHVISEEPFQDGKDYYSKRSREFKLLIAPKILGNAMNILKAVPAKIDAVTVSGYPDTCIVDAAIERNSDLIVMGPKRVRGIQSHIVGSVTKAVSINSPKPVLVIKPYRGSSNGTMKILFPTDGSDHARKAGELLLAMPFDDTLEITVLHVITPAFYDIPEEYISKMDPAMKEELKNFIEKEFRFSDEVVARTTRHLYERFSRVDSIIKLGDPADEILQTAYELKPDIIALGSKGMGGFRGLIGSISRYILSVTECSVLIGKM